MNSLILLCSAATLLLNALVMGAGDKVVCYHLQNRYDPNNAITNIEAGLCTHIITSFATLAWDNSHTIVYSGASVSELNTLRKKDPRVKIMLAIGGARDGTDKYIAMSATKSSRQRFINSVMGVVNSHGFDGIDMDWEFPEGSRQNENFVLLCRELKSALGSKLLSGAVYVYNGVNRRSYDARALGQILDFINVMTYDLRGAWDGETGVHCQMFKKSSESASQQKFTTVEGLKQWQLTGAPKEKLLLGIPLYSRDFNLRSSSSHGLHAPIISARTALPYSQVCKLVNDADGIVRDPQVVSPYAYKGSVWYGYEDPTSARFKGDWAKNNGYGGVFFWHLGQEDSKNNCGEGTFPVIKAAKAGLLGGDGAPKPVPTQPPVTQAPVTRAPVTQAPVTGAPVVTQVPVGSKIRNCKDQRIGYSYCDTTVPNKYFVCVHGRAYTMYTPAKTICKDTATGIIQGLA